MTQFDYDLGGDPGALGQKEHHRQFLVGDSLLPGDVNLVRGDLKMVAYGKIESLQTILVDFYSGRYLGGSGPACRQTGNHHPYDNGEFTSTHIDLHADVETEYLRDVSAGGCT
jgi:hypothetical protein